MAFTEPREDPGGLDARLTDRVLQAGPSIRAKVFLHRIKIGLVRLTAGWAKAVPAVLIYLSTIQAVSEFKRTHSEEHSLRPPLSWRDVSVSVMWCSLIRYHGTLIVYTVSIGMVSRFDGALR